MNQTASRRSARAALAAALCLFAVSSFAAPPQKVLYQGTLRRSGSIYTGNATFVFRLTDSSGATEYWTSGSTVVAVSMGLFRYPIGIDNAGGTGLSGKPLSGVDWPNITPYIEVTVDGTVLTPREAMASVPYALSNEDTTKLLKAGDAMTGPLTLSGSTLTISGNAFSVGGSSFTVFGGSATVAYSLSAGSFIGSGSALTGIPSSASIVGVYAPLSGASFTGNVVGAGSITASAFFGYGGNLSGLPSSEINTYVSSKTFTGNVLAGGSVTASAFFGYGGNLTGLPSSETNTYVSSKTFTGSVLSGGSVTASAFFGYGGNLSGIVAAEANTYASSKTFSGNVLSGGSVTASAFFGYGGNLTGISPGESNTYTSSKTFTADSFSVGGSSFSVSGGSATVSYRLSAGSFAGDGSALTGIPSTASISGTYLAKASDTMTGQLSFVFSSGEGGYDQASLPPGGSLIINSSGVVSRTSTGFSNTAGPLSFAFGYGGNTPGLVGVCTNGTEASPTACTDGTIITFIGAKPYDGTNSANTIGSAGALIITSSGTASTTSRATHIDLATTKFGTITRRNRLRVNANGMVAIAPRANTVTPLGALDVSGVDAGIGESGNGVSIYARENVVSLGSVTASAFFGYGGNLSGLPSSEANTYTSSKTFTADAFSVGGSSFTVSGGSATVAYRLSAGSFAGDGSALTGIPSTASISGTYLAKAGDTMTGNLFAPHVTATTSMTVTGNAFSVGASTFVITGGNVGIGTSVPGSKLDVEGGAQFGAGAAKSSFTATGALVMNSGSSITLSGANGFITGASSITASAFFGSGAALTNITATQMNAAGLINGPVNSAILPSTVAYTTSANTFTSSQTITADAFSVGGSTLVVAGGNIGIGTTAPASQLHLNGTGGAQLNFLGHWGGNYFVQSSSGGLVLESWGTTAGPNPNVYVRSSRGTGTGKVYINDVANDVILANGGGLVGIGTANPATTLEVNGSAQFGSGISKSTFTSAGALVLASGSSITLSGANGFITGASSITASAFFGSGAALTNITATQMNAAGLINGPVNSAILPSTVAYTTSANTFSSSQTITADAFSVGASTFVVAGGRVGISTAAPISKLQVHDGDIRISTSPSAASRGIYFQDGSLQTTAFSGTGSFVQRSGDGMTGPLTMLSGSTITIGGNAFSVGGSTLVVSGGNVGIGTTNPGQQLELTGNMKLPAASVIYSGAAPYIHNTGTLNFFAGVNAGTSTTTGDSNVGVGVGALASVTTTNGNTALGYTALNSNRAGSNTALGYQTLFSNNTGNQNTASGYQALKANFDGYENVAYGSYALTANTSGRQNVALGVSSLQLNLGGEFNTAVGHYSLRENLSGTHNVALGYYAGVTANAANANTSGTYNVFLGDSAGPGTSAQLTNAIAIGKNALVSANNAMALGGTGADAVNVAIGTATPASKLHVVDGDIRVSTSPGGGSRGIYFQDGSLQTTAAAGGNLWADRGSNRISNTNTGNVGIGTSAPGALFQVGGATLAATVSGNVGIGTTNPQAYLDLTMDNGSGSAANQYGLHISRSAGAGVTATNVYGIKINTLDYLGATTNVYGLYVGSTFASTAKYGIYVSDQGPMDNAYALYIAGTDVANKAYFGGKVGISTAAPTSKLHVHDGDIRISTTVGTASKGIYFQDGSLQITAAAGGNLWADRGSNNISNTNSANVGIGTTAPGGRLEVKAAASDNNIVQISSQNGTAILTIQKNGYIGLGSASGSVSPPRLQFYSTNGNTSSYIEDDSLVQGAGSLSIAVGASGLNLKTDGTTFNINQNGKPIRWGVYSSASLNLRGSQGFGGDVVMDDQVTGAQVFHAYLDPASSPYAVLFTSAPVAIGGTIGMTPAARLEVKASAADNIIVKVSSQNGTGILVANSQGGVGIGTTNPATKLHMSSGTLTIDGNATTSLTTTGNVGIGTTGPTAPLHISGSGSSGDPVIKSTATGSYGHSFEVGNLGLTILSKDNGALTWGRTSSSVGFGRSIANVNGIYFQTSPDNATYTDRLFISQTNGNVGIGTTGPGYALHVASIAYIGTGAAAPHDIMRFNLSGSSDYLIRENTSDIIRFGAGASGDFFHNISAGSVGISTAAPTSKLHVHDGDIRISTTTGASSRGIYFQDGTLQTSAAAGGNLWADRGSNNISNTNSANVGIGTSVPATKLHLSSGTILVDGNSATSLWTSGMAGIANGNAAGYSNGSGTHLFEIGVGTLNVYGGGYVGINMNGRISGNTSQYPLGVSYPAGTGAQFSYTNAGYSSGTMLALLHADIPRGMACLAFGPYSSITLPSAAICDDLINNGSPQAADLTFLTNPNKYNGSAYTNPALERMRITSLGDIGIGTTLPYARVHISTALSDTAALNNATPAVLKISNANNVTGNYSLIKFSFPNNDINALIGAQLTNSGNGEAALVFATRNTSPQTNEWMRITGSGNVGIGTINPIAKLDLQNTSATDSYSLLVGTGPSAYNLIVATTGVTSIFTEKPAYYTAPPAVSVLHLFKSSLSTMGTANQLLIGSANGVGALAQIGFGWTNTFAVTYAPGVFGFVATNSGGYTKGDFFVATRDVTTDSQPSERMRITSAGSIGISTAVPTAKLHVHDGDIRISTTTGGASRGIIFQDGTTQITAASGGVLQYVSSGTTGRTGAQGSAIPTDDTIPQIGEGFQVLSATITPIGSNNRLIIEANVNYDEAVNNCNRGALCLFKDATADAIACVSVMTAGSPVFGTATLVYKEATASTSQRVYSVRLGCESATTMSVNTQGGTNIYGNSLLSTLTITEISGP